MNYKFDPQTEYKLLEDFYASGTSESMPPELAMRETVYREAWRHLKQGVYSYKAVAQLIVKKFPEYGLKFRNAYNHVRNAARYYAECQIESADLHRARILDTLYKQKKLLEDIVAPHKPIETAREIRSIVAEIAKITGVYEPQLPEDLGSKQVVFHFHSDPKKVQGVNAVPEGRVINEIEAMAKRFELDEAEKNKIINEDVHGNLPPRDGY